MKTAKPITPPEDPRCTKCDTPPAQHTPHPPCGLPEQHHQPDDLELCWIGRARMAAAKQRAGEPLNALDGVALRRHPDPPFLTAAGYQ